MAHSTRLVSNPRAYGMGGVKRDALTAIQTVSDVSSPSFQRIRRERREGGREKKEDEERCGGCATRIDLGRRRMRNGDDKPADTGGRRCRIGR